MAELPLESLAKRVEELERKLADAATPMKDWRRSMETRLLGIVTPGESIDHGTGGGRIVGASDKIGEPLIALPPSEPICKHFQAGLQALKAFVLFLLPGEMISIMATMRSPLTCRTAIELFLRRWNSAGVLA